MKCRFIAFACLAVFTALVSYGCTSMLVSAKMSGTGRPMMWKHRDTGAPDNFLERVVPAEPGSHAYVGLFNGGDSLLCEAWMGMNDAGFAIMNTASYNLAPDTAAFKDQEGVMMAAALARCATLGDFEDMLGTWQKPMGIQANFGVMDAQGGLAYYECDDFQWRKYDVNDTAEGYIMRTNHSVSGDPEEGFGYARLANLKKIIADDIASGAIYPWNFTDKVSRSYWHSMLGHDFEGEGYRWAVDQDFIPRKISTSSIVIEGINPGETNADMHMWATLGYPPCSWAEAVTIDDVPESLRPTLPGWHSSRNIEADTLKAGAFPLHMGNGQKYIDMDYIRGIHPEMLSRSKRAYLQHYPEYSEIIEKQFSEYTDKK